MRHHNSKRKFGREKNQRNALLPFFSAQFNRARKNQNHPTESERIASFYREDNYAGQKK